MLSKSKRSRGASHISNDSQKHSKRKRRQGESSSRQEPTKGKEEEQWNFSVWYEWWTTEQKKKASKQALLLLAKDEKEYGRTKPCFDEDQEEYADFDLDELDYKDAHLAFDPEKSPKLDV